jgi:hypothetical protein
LQTISWVATRPIEWSNVLSGENLRVFESDFEPPIVRPGHARAAEISAGFVMLITFGVVDCPQAG